MQVGPAAGKPNLLMIVLDQLRWDCVGHVRPDLARTPHLDELARQGARFDHAYSCLPTCCPARQSLLAGTRPETFGALWNYDVCLPVGSLSPTERTWPQLLHDHGYAMAYLGKWHVSPTATPIDFGYDSYVSLADYQEARDAAGIPSLAGCPWTGTTDPAPLACAPPHWFAGRAAEWIARHSDEPWHLRLDLVEPHLPSCPAEPYAGAYGQRAYGPWPNFADSLDNKPYMQRQQRLNWGVERADWDYFEPMVQHYLAVIEQVDDAVGLVLDALDRAGCADRTLVVFSADHGDLCGAHGMLDKHYVMYDEVVRVPLIMRHPGVIAPGQVIDEFVYNFLDLPPTICAAAGVPADPRYQGRDLGQLLAGPAPPDWRQEVVVTHNGQQFGLYTQRMVRTSRWKYVWNASDLDELYDLDEDPHELHNRIADASLGDVLQQLRTRLYTVLEAEGDTQMTNPWLRTRFLHHEAVSQRAVAR